ncbi:hypothetical protein NHG29_00235 [Aerococcaceae bacterium NML160702]|nr:hypothetical protein [Aerococcaceae bacterium NML160702]
MPIIQVPMEMSEAAYKGLLSGELFRNGGVIYNATGGIYEHLKNTNLGTESQNKVAKWLSQLAQNPEGLFKNGVEYISNNKLKFGVVAGTIVIVGAGVIYGLNKVINKNNTKDNVSIEVNADLEFNSILNKYISESRKSYLNISTIQELKERLEMISNSDESHLVVVDIAKLQELMKYIRGYTLELAKVNDFNIDTKKINETDNIILDFIQYLGIQEEIFEMAS